MCIIPLSLSTHSTSISLLYPSVSLALSTSLLFLSLSSTFKAHYRTWAWTQKAKRGLGLQRAPWGLVGREWSSHRWHGLVAGSYGFTEPEGFEQWDSPHPFPLQLPVRGWCSGLFIQLCQTYKSFMALYASAPPQRTEYAELLSGGKLNISLNTWWPRVHHWQHVQVDPWGFLELLITLTFICQLYFRLG